MGNSPHKIDEFVPAVLGCVAFARSSKGMGSSYELNSTVLRGGMPSVDC